MPASGPIPIRSTATNDEFGGFRITIPRGTELGGCVVGCGLVVWSLVLLLALAYVVSNARNAEPGRFTFLIVWTVLGLAVLAFNLFAAPVAEIVIIDEKSIVIRTEYLRRTYDRAFALVDVRNLRVTGNNDAPGHLVAVAFDCNGTTVGFGHGLSHNELLRIAKTIRQRFRIRDDLDDAEPLPVAT